MFEEVPIILGFMIFSIIFSYFVLKYTPKPISLIVKGLAAIGIVIHEICHVIMCLLTRTPMENISVLKKVNLENDSGKTGFYGQVKVYENKISFLQAIAVGFGPLFLSFWFFFWILSMLIHFRVHPLIFGIGIILMISLALSAAPSFSDLTIIPKAFSYDTEHSLYQILLILLAVLTTWLIESSSNLLFHEWHIYLIITGFYFVFKFGFQLIRNIYYALYERGLKGMPTRNFQKKKIIYRSRKPWKE